MLASILSENRNECAVWFREKPTPTHLNFKTIKLRVNSCKTRLLRPHTLQSMKAYGTILRMRLHATRSRAVDTCGRVQLALPTVSNSSRLRRNSRPGLLSSMQVGFQGRVRRAGRELEYDT